MKGLRFLLFPFSFFYWIITSIRNGLFNSGLFKSYDIPGKSIIVGNLSVGGTGKSPHVDYLIQHLLAKNRNTTTLSRGYGRTTSGFIEANHASLSSEIGDEPLMFKSKHGESINVTVCEDRTAGVKEIQKRFSKNEIIILDDAFQHRKVKAGLNILVSDYSKPFYNDFILPVGRLRESRSGSKRADIIIISKCPSLLDVQKKNEISKTCKLDSSRVFFSSIKYGDLQPISESPIQDIENVLLVTGIANPTPLLNHLKSQYKVEHLNFKDHHEFNHADIEKIHEKFDTFASARKAIITTEKDYMRLKRFSVISSAKYQWFYQPIDVEIDKEKEFKALIDQYVGEI